MDWPHWPSAPALAPREGEHPLPEAVPRQILWLTLGPEPPCSPAWSGHWFRRTTEAMSSQGWTEAWQLWALPLPGWLPPAVFTPRGPWSTRSSQPPCSLPPALGPIVQPGLPPSSAVVSFPETFPSCLVTPTSPSLLLFPSPPSLLLISMLSP